MLGQWLRYQEVSIVKGLKALPGSPIPNVQHCHKSHTSSLFVLHDFVFLFNYVCFCLFLLCALLVGTVLIIAQIVLFQVMGFHRYPLLYCLFSKSTFTVLSLVDICICFSLGRYN